MHFTCYINLSYSLQIDFFPIFIWYIYQLIRLKTKLGLKDKCICFLISIKCFTETAKANSKVCSLCNVIMGWQ